LLNARVLIALFALIQASCSTSALYRGDGKIRTTSAGTHEIIFPPIDIGKSCKTVFTFSGPPSETFAPALYRNDDGSSETYITMTIQDAHGKVCSRRTGKLGKDWQSGNGPDPNPNWRYKYGCFSLDGELQSRLSTFGSYELVIEIDAHEPQPEKPEFAAPAVESVFVSF
jgi:hypothetical protein